MPRNDALPRTRALPSPGPDVDGREQRPSAAATPAGQTLPADRGDPPTAAPPRADVTDAPPGGLPAGAEIELRLVTEPGRLPAFRDAPVIAANARNRGVHRRLQAIYYDTADRRLRKAGLTLRVRRSGSRFT